MATSDHGTDNENAQPSGHLRTQGQSRAGARRGWTTGTRQRGCPRNHVGRTPSGRTDFPDQSAIPLKCYVDGGRRILSVAKAYIQFWIVQFAWLRPIDWYRCSIQGHRFGDYIDRFVQARPCFMLKLLHRRGRLALTAKDVVALDPKTTYLSDANLHSRAARFNNTLYAGLPEQLRPFEHCEVYERDNRLVSAYRLKPGVSIMMIVGVDPRSGLSNDAVDWTIFLTPPEPETSGGAEQ